MPTKFVTAATLSGRQRTYEVTQATAATNFHVYIE